MNAPFDSISRRSGRATPHQTSAMVLTLMVATMLGGCVSAAKGSGAVAEESGAQASVGVTHTRKAPIYHFKIHKVNDRQGTGKLAGTFLLPAGWSSTDLIKWIPNNFLTPVVGSSQIKSPDNLQQFSTISGFSSVFGHSPTGNFGNFPVSKVSDLLLKSWKQDHPGIQFAVVAKSDTPLSHSEFAQGGMIARATRGLVKITYRLGDKIMLCKASAQYDVYRTPTQATAIGGEMYEGGWLVSSARFATAPQASFATSMKLFDVIVTSYRTDLHFFNTVAQVQQMIQQNFYARQNAIMETSRIIAQTNQEISDTIMSSYHDREAVYEKSAIAFDDTIRGVERYQDDDGKVVLPSGYSSAWSDGNGGYLLTDQVGYDPNTHSTSTSWHELPHAH